MLNRLSFPACLVALMLCGAAGPWASRVLVAQTVAERVRERLRTVPHTTRASLLTRFYVRRDYRPAWVTDTGPLPASRELAAAVGAASTEGLDAGDYPLGPIRRLLASSRGADGLARLELLLSETLLAFGSDLARGRIEPTTMDTAWTASPLSLDLAAVATQIDSAPLGQVLTALAPPAPGYARLRLALGHYRDIAARGGWPHIPAGPELAPGDSGARVGLLKSRLALELGVSADTSHPDVYDDGLARTVRWFQATHGLEVDARVGPATLVALNVPVADRIRAMELNLERWRWLPRDLGESYVMVNSAAFSAELVDRDHATMTMRAIVGRSDWPTPIVSSRIVKLVFSPAWDIPKSIALAEVLPLARRDPHYIGRERITVFRDSDGVAREMDPLTVNWGAITDSTFSLRLTQAPGGQNPLGGIKFVLGSRFGVRIHDTPARSRFGERVRTFSHGCIRVERPAELAAALLQDSLRWPLDSVRAKMNEPDEESVPLPRPMPVHLSYQTVWVDQDGAVEFRNDVYGWDRRLSAALATRGRVRILRPRSRS